MADKKPKKKTTTKGKKGAGRKNWWDMLQMDSKLASIEGWAKQGSTNEEMWTTLGISKDLFYKWQRERPQFAEALRKGKFESNGEILGSAFRQATGYYQEVIEPFKVKTLKEFTRSDNGKKFWEEHEEIIDHTYMKYFPPNNTMGIFMLKNRLPEFYRDKIEHEHNGDVGVMFVDDIPQLPPVGGVPDEKD